MELEQVACYLCGASENQPWGSEMGFTMVKCAGCGLVYLNPRPSANLIDEAARTGMHRTSVGGMVAVGRYSRARASDYRRKLADLFPPPELMQSPVRWLDIGAGYGELIQALSSSCHPDSTLLGLEPCEPKVAKAKSLGLPVEQRSLDGLNGTFTHISLINVFSHLPNPIEFLTGLKPFLAPGGQLLLVTGNGGDISREEFPGSLYLPDHLSFAGHGHLMTILERAGFSNVSVKSYPAGASVDNLVMGACKNVARLILGRAPVPLWVPQNSPFRSLWLRALSE